MTRIQTKSEVFEKAVLAYFNQCLLDKSVISKQEFQTMNRKIKQQHQTRF